MKDTKLIQILKTFSKEETKEFEKFVASPYFSRGRDLLPFYKTIKSFYPDFDNTDFTYEKVFKKLNPKENYSKLKADNVLRVLSSELLKLAEEFLTYEEFKLTKLNRRIRLLDAYLGKGLIKFFTKLLSDTLKDVYKQSGEFTGGYFVELYFLKMNEVSLAIYSNRKYGGTLEAQSAMMIFFFLSAVNFIESAYKNKINYNIDAKDDLVFEFMRGFDVKRFISYLEQKPEIKGNDKEILQLCFYCLSYTLERDNENYITQIEKLFYKNKHLFRIDHKLSFYFLLVRAYGRTNNLNKLYLLYENILKDKIYEPGDGMKIPFILYYNILYLFAEKNIIDAEKFIEKYTKSLATDNVESFRNFSFALLEFKKGNFENALKHISKVEDIFHHLKYLSKILTLQIYYELNYVEEADFIIDSFKHFLKKNQYVPDELGINFKRFVDHYKKLINIKMSGRKQDLEILRMNIEDEGRLFYRNWLLEKIQEIKKQK